MWLKRAESQLPFVVIGSWLLYMQVNMADDKLIFPIGFDLEEGVKAAEKNADAFLQRLQKAINSQPLAIKINADGFSELGRSMETLAASLARLNGLLANKNSEATTAEQRLTQAITEQGSAVANTSNTISRHLMEQERANKALRDTYTEQERVNGLISQYHDTYEGQVESLARLNAQLAANKKAQSDNAKALEGGRISAAKYAKTNVQLLAQHRQLSAEKRALNQVMTAEEKAMLAQEGSYKQLSQQLSLLKTAYKELGDEGRTSSFGQDLEATIQNLDAHLKDMAADMGEFQRNVGNYAIAGQNGVVATESLTAAINQEARTMQDLIDQTKILEEAKRMLNKDDANYQSTLVALNAKLDENKRKLSDVSDILGKEAKSVAEAEAQNKRLSEAIKHVDLKSADAEQQLEALRGQIARNNQTINAATGANERYADSVLGLVGINNNFGSSLQSLGEGGNFIDGLKTKVTAFGKTLIGLLANPAVLAFLGIAGVAAGFKWWYDYNKELVEASKLTQDLTGLTGDSMKAVRNEVQAVADTYNKDFREVLNGANSLAKQFGIPIQEAMKLVKDGFVAGADANGEFLENIKEYPAYFKEAGISASEFIAITTQATKAGVYSDKGVDAIKEGNIRLREMTTATAKALDGIGISSKQVKKELADGSKSTFDVMQQVSAKLAGLPQSSSKVGAALADIFGGPGEDAGLQYILTLKDIDTNLDNVKGRAGELGRLQEEQLQSQIELENTIASVFDATGGSFESLTTHAKIFINDGIIAIIRGCVDIVNWFIRMYNKSLVVRGGVNSIVNTFKTLWEIGKFVINQVVDSFAALGTVIEGVVTLDWDKVKQGYSDGMKALGGNLEKLVGNIAANTADAFSKTLKDEMKEVSVDLKPDDNTLTDSSSNISNTPNKPKPIGEQQKKAAETYLQILNKIEQSITTINAKYTDLAKKEGNTKALEHTNKLYKTQLAYINAIGKQFGLSFKMPTSFESLQEYRTAILDVINKLKASGVKGALDAVLGLEMNIGMGNIDKLGKEVESKIKQLADRISRTKTAREFYDKVLGMTGDYELAGKVALSIYGDTGFDLQQQLADQIRQYFQNDSINVEIPVDVITSDNQINYKKLGEFAEKYKTELGEKPYESVKKIAEQGQKDLAKTYEGYFKDLEKAKTYASQRIELAQTTAAKIRQIRADMASGQTDKAVGENLISGLIDKEMKEAAKLEWDAFKGTPLYTQMFEDLEHASTSTLEMMRSRLEALSRTWGSALDPTQLKEMQGRMNEITDQLRDRNPWKQLQEAYRQYKDATDSVTFTGAVSKSGEAAKNFYDAAETYDADSVQAKAAEQELQAREKIVGIVKQITEEQGKQVKGQKALTLAQQKSFDMEMQARGNLEIAAAELKAAEDKATAEGKDPATDPGVVAARERVNKAKEEVELTTKTSEIITEAAKKSMTWKETLKSATGMVTSGLNAMGDLAAGIAKVTEAMGADEEDVQYWNDIASALDDVASGIQDIVNAAMSGDVVGIISSVLTAIPKMFVGFANLFSAGKIRKANKEIKRQQELLDQLEYSYGRLEKAAEKLFGAEYISNYNRRLKNLQAQAEAYRKQAEAERSKGKKADEAKIKEHENSYRNTLDEIADMQGQVAARMLGTDLTSAARDFAKAWLDAYKQFGNTADAMSEKFHEMIENMVVESLLAKVMKKALEPAFKMIDEYDGAFMNEDFWRKVSTEAAKGAKNADYGARTVMSFLEQAGLSVRSLGGEMTGISRDIASASEESINGLAKGVNTQNYYMMQISGNVAAMLRLMEGGGNTISVGGGVDTTALLNQHLELQQGIYRHTAETVAECRNIAQKCQEQTDLIRRVIAPRNSSATHSVQVIMK